MDLSNNCFVKKGYPMKFKIVLLIAAILPTATFAQSTPQQVSPAEAAIQIDSMVNQVAQLATNQTRAIESLQKQVQDQQKEIADLHKKLDASKVSSVAPSPPKPLRK